MDVTCIPSVEGNCTHQLRPGDAPSQADNLYWEISDIPAGQQVAGQTKAFRLIDNNGTKMLRWQGNGSRPDQHRGPCQSFAHENFRADHTAITLTMRVKVEDFVPNGGEDKRRFYNFEFETTVPKPVFTNDNETTYQFRFEAAAVKRYASGELKLVDYRAIPPNPNGDEFCTLKPAGGQPKWVKIWAVMKLPTPPYTNNNTIYDMWIDEGTGWVSKPWTDRDKGGWSDVEITGIGDKEKSVVQFDYICYTYGAYNPGTIAIPSEANPATPMVPVSGFDKNNLNHIRQQPDGYAVDITSDKIVTGIFTDPVNQMKFYYISETDGTEGIRVNLMTGKSVVDGGGNPVTLALGNKVQLKGGLCSTGAEKTIHANMIQRTATTTILPAAAVLEDYQVEGSYRTQLDEFFPPQTLDGAETGTITGIVNDLRLPWIVNPTWSTILCSEITVAGKSWTADEWRGATLIIPAQGSHTDLYYTVVANTADTLTLTRPSFWVSINLGSDGVATGETCRFAGDGGDYHGDRFDGRLVEMYGYVSSVDAGGRTFCLDNGAPVAGFETLQDIMMPYNPALDATSYSLWFSPSGLRVALQNGGLALPAVGDYAYVRGCLGAYHYKKLVLAHFPLSRDRDEIKESIVMPVVWSDVWESRYAADLDRNGAVAVPDLVIFAGNWLHAASDYADPGLMPAGYLLGDISGVGGLPDGRVNLADFGVFAGQWLSF